MPLTKAWDWSKNTSNRWLNPCIESSYLAERWFSMGFKQFLDLGCGLGRHSVYMAKHGFDVTAVDLSENGVKYTTDWATKENLDVKACVSNMLELPFDDSSFDCIISYHVIYHTDTEGFIKVLQEIHRVLRQNGEIFLTLNSKNARAYLNANASVRIDENTILKDDREIEKDIPHFYVNIEDIKKYFADFEYVKHPVEYREYRMEDSERYSTHWYLIVKRKGS